MIAAAGVSAAWAVRQSAAARAGFNFILGIGWVLESTDKRVLGIMLNNKSFCISHDEWLYRRIAPNDLSRR
jgi:hypothetical protein